MSEVYTVVIRGGSTSPNQISGTATDGMFRVDWQRALPKGYNSFRMDTYFRSVPDPDYESTMVYVRCSAFPKSGSFDTLNNNEAGVICVAPLYAYGSTYFYHETPSTSASHTVKYPTENMLNVVLTTHDGTTVATTGFTEWTLILTFTPLA
eukprot:51635-Eustigmatos_ZCMA.PRE.1